MLVGQTYDSYLPILYSSYRERSYTLWSPSIDSLLKSVSPVLICHKGQRRSLALQKVPLSIDSKQKQQNTSRTAYIAPFVLVAMLVHWQCFTFNQSGRLDPIEVFFDHDVMWKRIWITMAMDRARLLPVHPQPLWSCCLVNPPPCGLIQRCGVKRCRRCAMSHCS